VAVVFELEEEQEEEARGRMEADLEDVEGMKEVEDDLADMNCGEQDMSSRGLLPSSPLIPTDNALLLLLLLRVGLRSS
jgi:chromatin segregation and condensation protein Rec8/ScpA/Scc1 (kleisin family)